jgi:hypothetical protein
MFSLQSKKSITFTIGEDFQYIKRHPLNLQRISIDQKQQKNNTNNNKNRMKVHIPLGTAFQSCGRACQYWPEVGFVKEAG